MAEKEMLAVEFALEKFQPYVKGYPFIVITDSSALTHWNNLKDPTGRLAQWALLLQ